MKELIEKVANAFRPVKEDLGNGRKVFHQDYKVDDAERPIHFKPEIARHVLNQGIVSKLDFIAFVNEYKTEATKLFYNNDRVKAVFNYSTKDTVDHADSVCYMQLQETEDYNQFKINQAQLSQKQFVRFLKRMEPYIVAFDNNKADDMDIIEMAEHLQAIKTIDSVQRNSQQKFHLDVNIQTGKDSMILPRVITFEFPIFKNDRDMTTRFETELFLSADDGSLAAELICYNIDQLYEESIRELTTSILADIDDVSAFQS
jgi:uncharacterized protein YfdQ (DUF2303 family)